MSRLTAMIAEDEAPQREALCALLSELWPELELVAVCDDGLYALEALDKYRPRLLFLDIRMPGRSGMEVARVAADTEALVVFTTAYDQYAIAAFEAGAVDYLLKPISVGRLGRTLERIRQRLRGRDRPDYRELLDRLLVCLADQNSESLKWIAASIGNTVRMFDIDEVLYFHARNKYTQVVTVDDEAVIRTSLKDLLLGLDSEVFWQVHRSVIVRVSAIERVLRNELGKYELRLRGRTETLPVSASFRYRFRGM